MLSGSGSILVFKNGLLGMNLKDNLDYLEDSWKISGFGGAIEKGETAEECLARELYEELEIKLSDYNFEFFNSTEVTLSDGRKSDTRTHIVWNVDIEKLNIHEGNLLVFNRHTDLSYLVPGIFAKEYLAEIVEYINQKLNIQGN